MWCWWILKSVVLVSARRSVLVGDPNSRSQVSVQTFTASLTAESVGQEELCFRVVESLACRQHGKTGCIAELKVGDVQCLKLGDQSEGVRSALKILVEGGMVKLRKTTDVVVKLSDLSGGQTRESTIVEQVKVLRVGDEISRKTQTVQKITATYTGHGSDVKHKMFVNDGDEASTELACFNVKKSWGYSTKTNEKNTSPMLQKSDDFCISPDDTVPETRTLIGTLSVGRSVLVNLVSEQITLANDIVIEYSVTMVEGTSLLTSQRSVQQSSATVTQIDNGELCVQLVTTSKYEQIEVYGAPKIHDGGSLCFFIHLQNIKDQTTLFTLSVGSTVQLLWESDWVSFAGNAENMATGENIIREIVVLTQSWEKVSSVPQTVQKMVAEYTGVEPDSVVDMLATKEGTPSDLGCFKVNKTLGFEKMTESKHTEMKPKTEFCVCVADQKPNFKTTIDALQSGTTVTMTWIHETVTYEMTARDGSNWMAIQSEHTSMVTDGIESVDSPTSVQEATLISTGSRYSTDDGMKYCFKVVEVSKTHVAQNSFGHNLIKKDDAFCFILAVQNVQVMSKLLTIPESTSIEVKWGSAWVSYEDVIHSTTYSSTSELIISKFTVPTGLQKQEFYRTPRTVQKFTATYTGSTKTTEAKLYVNGESTLETTVLACFMVNSPKGFSAANTNWENEEMQANDEFCIDPYDQTPADQLIVLGLEAENLVTVDWLHETVEYSIWENNRDGWKKSFESAHSFIIRKGSEIQSADLSNQEADVTFNGETLTTEQSREFCFKLVTHGWYTRTQQQYNTQIVVGDRLCLTIHLQTPEMQTKLLALPTKSTMKLRWKFVEVYYWSMLDTADAETILEPIVTDIHRTN